VWGVNSGDLDGDVIVVLSDAWWILLTFGWVSKQCQAASRTLRSLSVRVEEDMVVVGGLWCDVGSLGVVMCWWGLV
jgi:hypothetical protein